MWGLLEPESNIGFSDEESTFALAGKVSSRKYAFRYVNLLAKNCALLHLARGREMKKR